MSFVLSVYEQLAADTTVTDIVSTSIYRGSAPQSAAIPYVVMHEISKPHAHHLGGASGLAMPRIQIDCIANDPDTCETISEAIRDTLDGFRGTLGTSNTTNVRKMWLDTELDDNFSPQDGSDVPIYRRIMDFSVAHAESVPSLA